MTGLKKHQNLMALNMVLIVVLTVSLSGCGQSGEKPVKIQELVN
ncbi:unnamed protein product [marine sediment metagenome]|uniref:Uncharacterized protein n=1 Tax=marine sediment metagenome TaxID=412755 RepID=X1N4A2_9ZZZZ